MGLAADALLLIHLPLLRRAVVGGLGQPVGEVQQILGHADRVEEGTLAVKEVVGGKQALDPFSHDRHFQDTLAARPHLGRHLDQGLHQVCEVRGVDVRYFRVDTSKYFLIEPLHVVSSKRRFQGYRFIEHAPERPDVALVVVGLISPDLGARIVRRPRLSVEHALLGDLGNIHVAQLTTAVLVEEHVGALQVPMKNLYFMQTAEPPGHLDEDLPNVVLFEERVVLLVIAYLLEEIARVGVLHHNATLV